MHKIIKASENVSFHWQRQCKKSKNEKKTNCKKHDCNEFGVGRFARNCTISIIALVRECTVGEATLHEWPDGLLRRLVTFDSDST